MPPFRMPVTFGVLIIFFPHLQRCFALAANSHIPAVDCGKQKCAQAFECSRGSGDCNAVMDHDFKIAPEIQLAVNQQFKSRIVDNNSGCSGIEGRLYGWSRIIFPRVEDLQFHLCRNGSCQIADQAQHDWN